MAPVWVAKITAREPPKYPPRKEHRGKMTYRPRYGGSEAQDTQATTNYSNVHEKASKGHSVENTCSGATVTPVDAALAEKKCTAEPVRHVATVVEAKSWVTGSASGCFYCGEAGHFKRECPQLGGKGAGKGKFKLGGKGAGKASVASSITSAVNEQAPADCQSKEMALSIPSEVATTDLSCPGGHTLQEFTTHLPSMCGFCNNKAVTGALMWGCRACDFDICVHCQQGFVGCIADEHSTASTDTPRQDGDVMWTNVDQVWWPQDVPWGWDWHEAEAAKTTEVCGDESLVGPDGEVYEIFYPGECRSAASDATTEAKDSRPSSPAISSEISDERPQTEAEAGILSILTFMRGVAVERYPARAHLFESVQAATSVALGDHFQRFALVGSTALRIDTPDSDLDAVVFTKSRLSESGEEVQPPMGADLLRQVAAMLTTCDPSLRLQLVDCTRVPVLTVFSDTDDGMQSLDLTVDQPLSEWHVLWLQSQRKGPTLDSPLMQGVPVPSPEILEQGLEANALRCVKWWLRRRHIPVSKEGGYPTVVWTLMVIHALRCSVFYNEADGGKDRDAAVTERTLLSAIAAFFDRFAEGGLAGTLLFADGQHAQFWPQQASNDHQQLPALSSGAFSVLDPTTTSEDSAAYGIEPLELAPRISSATQLLQAYELQRAQQLSSLALNSDEGGAALSLLFAEVDELDYLLPAVVPQEPTGVVLLSEGSLVFGILRKINLKPGWSAAFLHRHDKFSRLAVEVCNVDFETCTAVTQDSSGLQWLSASDVVCMATIRRCDEASSWGSAFDIHSESFARWCSMHALLGIDMFASQQQGQQSKSERSRQNKSTAKARKRNNKRHGETVRI